MVASSLAISSLVQKSPLLAYFVVQLYLASSIFVYHHLKLIIFLISLPSFICMNCESKNGFFIQDSSKIRVSWTRPRHTYIWSLYYILDYPNSDKIKQNSFKVYKNFKEERRTSYHSP